MPKAQIAKLKVMTIVGTRPEIIKLSRVIAKLDRYTDHILIHTGQNYDHELSGIFFEQLQIRKPDRFLDAVGETAAETIGLIISKADAALREIRPDAVLVYGDTNSCLACIAAKRLHIPIFHMEAGNRCFDDRVPEEINRRIVDHTSDINMTLTEHARRYLLREGLRPDTVFKIGSSMKEIIAHFKDQISASTVLRDLGLVEQGYFVVSSHREENVDSAERRDKIIECLRQMAGRFDRDIIFSTHPRLKKHLQIGALDRVSFVKPLGFIDYIALQKSAFCVVSDSGTLTEESSLLKFPAVMLREAHERPEGMDVGALVMSGLDPSRVIECINVVTEQRAAWRETGTRGPATVPDYEVDNVSDKVVRIILSYTDYVNRVVWRCT